MTAQLSAGAIAVSAVRPRPRVHFTAEDGWINDPYGITWTGDRYHLFYQAIPGRVTWAPGCGWGHAESPDLVRWRECEPALVPGDSELGCWSGSVVPDGAGLWLFYTQVTDPDWGRGAVAVARPVGGSWATQADDVLVPEPPGDLGVHTFRDPFVFQRGDEWVMIVGAALHDGSGAAVQYHSPDREAWTCDGLLASRHSTPDDAVWTGSMWECPQLFPFGDSWVLLVSVWHDDVLHYVTAATGDYDGRQFAPRTWQRLTHGWSAYAMTAFVDRAGRRCVMSWLREEPQNDPSLVGRAGAHSVAALLTRTDTGRLALRPHPDLATLGEPIGFRPSSAGETRTALGARAAEITLAPTPGLRVQIADGAGTLVALTFGATELHVARRDRPDGVVPVIGRGEMRLLADADLLEVFGAGGYGAFRIGVATDPEATEIVITAPHPEFTLRIL